MKLPTVQSRVIYCIFIIGCFAVLNSMTSPVAMARGFYGVVDTGQTSFGKYCDYQQPPGYYCSQNKDAIRFGGGYQFSRYFGLEAIYGNLGSVKLNGTWGGANVIAEGKFTSVQIATNFSLPLTDAFSLLFKLGAARTTVVTTYSCCYGEEKQYDDMSVYGIGAQYDISRQFAFRTDYEILYYETQSLFGNSTRWLTIPLFTAGIVWKF